jgi:hypothetical protein
MKEFATTLLGDQTLSHFAALLFFALFGTAVSLLIQATTRDVSSPATPVYFSWPFFFSDNWKRITLGFMLILIALRFTPQLFGMPINEWWALAIGFSLDKVAQALKDRTNVLGQKKTTP